MNADVRKKIDNTNKNKKIKKRLNLTVNCPLKEPVCEQPVEALSSSSLSKVESVEYLIERGRGKRRQAKGERQAAGKQWEGVLFRKRLSSKLCQQIMTTIYSLLSTHHAPAVEESYVCISL
jgi:hypothetical protein